MSNNFVQSMICQPVGGKVIQLNINKPLDMKALAQDLKMLFRSEGMTVYATYSPNILILQLHARGLKGHYYTTKICQDNNKVVIETGITSARVQLEWAGVEGGIAGASDLLLHNKFLALLGSAFAGVDVASVLGSYEQEQEIINQIVQVITSHQQAVSQQTPRYCPNCGYPVAPQYKFCPNCGYRLM